MKRFMIATALTLSMAAPAYAATDAEMSIIRSYMPEADVSAWSDAEVNTALSIINSGESRSNIVGQLNALYEGSTYTPTAAEITEAEMAILSGYVSDVDFSMYPQATIDAAINVSNSDIGESDKQERIQALLNAETAPMGDTNTATAAEVALINQYAPDVNVAALTDEQVNAVLAIIYSTDSEDTEARVEAYVETNM